MPKKKTKKKKNLKRKAVKKAKKKADEKPNCYDCMYREGVPGSAHSSCGHPEAEGEKTPLGNLMSIFASVGRVGPIIGNGTKLGVTGDPTGVKNGWFNWPYNFDPVWLQSCGGFKKEKKSRERKTA
jgi:hypothetical protein